MTSSTFILARVYEHIEPIDRGERYEDPLDAALKDASLGEVTGGGSQLTASGEIAYAELEIEVRDRDAALLTIVQAMENSGAPVGSEILVDDAVVKTFGKLQSVAVYLDGVSLPDDVYETLDFDETITVLTQAAGAESYHGFWQGAEETGLYFFGPNADEMFERLDEALRAIPIGQNARVVIRRDRDASHWRTVRMPRHEG